MPAVLASTTPTAPMDLSMAHSTGAVYGPGVTSTPLATDTVLGSHPAISTAAAPVQVLTQTAPTGITCPSGPPPVPPAQQFANPIGHLGNPPRQLHATGALPADAAPLPTPAPAARIGFDAPPALATAHQAAPVSPPGGLVLREPPSESQGIAPGPLQAGQIMAPGPVAEGTEHSLQASESDAWSDADSVMAEPLSQTWHERSTQPGPVGEGVETNSDAWSDSASSEPGTLISGSQAMVRVPYCSGMYLLLGLLLLVAVVTIYTRAQSLKAAAQSSL